MVRNFVLLAQPDKIFQGIVGLTWWTRWAARHFYLRILRAGGTYQLLEPEIGGPLFLTPTRVKRQGNNTCTPGMTPDAPPGTGCTPPLFCSPHSTILTMVTGGHSGNLCVYVRLVSSTGGDGRPMTNPVESMEGPYLIPCSKARLNEVLSL